MQIWMDGNWRERNGGGESDKDGMSEMQTEKTKVSEMSGRKLGGSVRADSWRGFDHWNLC